MSDDQTFRIALIVGMLVVLPIGVYHRLKSQATREKLDRRQEGIFILTTLRPVGFVLIFSVLAYIIDPSSMAWSSWPAPTWLRWVGVGVLAISGGLFIWTFRSLGKNLTDTVVTRREHELVTSGPYRWVRHPFYVSVTLFVAASALITANWLIPLVGIVFLCLLVVRTRTEEDKLLARFGDGYRDYMERTGRFWPRLGANRRV